MGFVCSDCGTPITLEKIMSLKESHLDECLDIRIAIAIGVRKDMVQSCESAIERFEKMQAHSRGRKS